jgi:hypothetical protein
MEDHYKGGEPMKKSRRRLLVVSLGGIALVCLLVVILSESGYIISVSEESSTGNVPNGSGPEMHRMEDFFRGEFSVKGEPALDQEVEVIFTVTPIEDSFNTGIWIYLPEGIELLQGDTHWEGDLTKDEVFTMKIMVKPIQEGQIEIFSHVRGDVDDAERDWAYFLYFLTSATKGQISRNPFYHEPHPVEGELKELIVDLGLKSPISTKVGEEMVLTFSLVASRDMKNVKAVIKLPEEFIYIEGTLEWTGDLKAAQEEIFQVTIKSTKKGRFEVLGFLTYDKEELTYKYDIFVH